MAVPSVAMPLFKESARPPLAPAKTQREAGLSKAQSGAGNSKIFAHINPKHDAGWEKMGTREGNAEKAWTEGQHLMKGTIRREAMETVELNTV